MERYVSSSLLESSMNFPMSGRGGGRMREGRGRGRERTSGVSEGSRCSVSEGLRKKDRASHYNNTT